MPTLQDDVISYYSLDEASGNVLDAHASNDLTAANAPGTADGKVATCRTFSSDLSQAALLNDTTGIFKANASLTITGWMYSTVVGASVQSLLGKATNSTNLEWKIFRVNTDLLFRTYTAAGATIATATASNVFTDPKINTWQFFAVWQDSSNNTINIKVDGDSAVSVSNGGSYPNKPAVYLNLACDFVNTARNWSGRVDELAFFGKALSTEEIDFIYSSGNGTSYADLTDYPPTVTENSNFLMTVGRKRDLFF